MANPNANGKLIIAAHAVSKTLPIIWYAIPPFDPKLLESEIKNSNEIAENPFQKSTVIKNNKTPIEMVAAIQTKVLKAMF